MAKDIKELFEGQELSEEFVKKAETLFEARVTEKENELKEQYEALEEELKEKYENLSEQYVEEVVVPEFGDKLDNYLNYVVENWMTENALAIENGVKVEIAENLLSGMKDLFVENNVSVPEGQEDMVESLEDRLNETTEKMNFILEENVSLKNEIKINKAKQIFNEETIGLTEIEKDRLATLSESINFSSEEDYRERLNILKSEFNLSESVESKQDSEILKEEFEEKVIDPNMERYVSAIKKFNS